jgi:hypothetical protein
LLSSASSAAIKNYFVNKHQNTKNTFGLVQGMLDLLLLDLQSTDDLLELVDRSASLAELVSQVLDLLGQRFVLAASAFKSFRQLILDLNKPVQ